MKTVQEFYYEYKIFPRLQMHMLRVTSVASIICDNFTEAINKEQIVLAALFHDMGNIIKAKNINFFNDFNEEELKYWEGVKKEFIEKYGEDEHHATVEIMKEIGLSERIVSLADQNRFGLIWPPQRSNDWQEKILHYADGRVNPYGVVSYAERMGEADGRYKSKTEEDERRKKELVNCGLEIEKQIFEKCSIKPEDITAQAVEPLIEELKNFVVK